jgi:hypothetical protein
MTPLAGLNRVTVSHQEAHAQPDAPRRADRFGQTAVQSRRLSGDRRSVGGSAMGAYRRRTGPAAGRRRHALHLGEPWDFLTTSPS